MGKFVKETKVAKWVNNEGWSYEETVDCSLTDNTKIDESTLREWAVNGYGDEDLSDVDYKITITFYETDDENDLDGAEVIAENEYWVSEIIEQ